MPRPIIFYFLIQLFIFQEIFSQENSLLINDIKYIDVLNGIGQTGDILIEEGKIKEISDNITPNTNQKEIDGTGKWLIPGLVDAHIHLFQSGGIYTRPDVLDLRNIKPYEDEIKWLQENASDLLKRYLRCGITTVIDVGGPMYNYELRKQFEDATEYPNLFLTGPLVSTYQPEAFKIEDPPIVKVNNREEAVDLVQKQLPFKPDFIKIWYIARATQSAESTYDIVEATIAESHKNGLKVAVHATQLNTAKLAVKAGADILVHSVDEPIDEDFINLLLENEVIYIPTLVVHANYFETFDQSNSLTKEDFTRSNPFPLGSLQDPQHFSEGNMFEQFANFRPQMLQRLQKQDSIRAENLKRLSETEIIISTGTDAGNIGTLHASSYYDELAYMQKAGMSNTQILKASTINGAKALGKENELGSVEVGKVADLLILNSNPLEDIEAIKEIDFVIKGGNLMKADAIITESPEHLAQQQLNAYNAGDIEAFLAPYSDDVEIYNFPNNISGKGKENIRPQYEHMFNNYPDLHCELVNRMVLGNTVIDQEKVTGIPNVELLEAIAIYKIENNKIAKVYFIRK